VPQVVKLTVCLICSDSFVADVKVAVKKVSQFRKVFSAAAVSFFDFDFCHCINALRHVGKVWDYPGHVRHAPSYLIAPPNRISAAEALIFKFDGKVLDAEHTPKMVTLSTSFLSSL
jgi:hypothetical protein